MSFKKRYTGYTEKTMENRLTGAGAYLRNYDVGTDTFTSAVSAGKLIGATQGGGSFVAKPTIRTEEIDGVPAAAKGMSEIDGWEVSLTANILEVTADVLKLTLGAATIETHESGKYKVIKGKNTIDTTDYENNITFIGTMSGFEEPIILQVYNALAVDGVTINTKDKASAVVPTTFKGHVDATNLDEPPFAIFVPIATTEVLATFAQGSVIGTIKATISGTAVGNTLAYRLSEVPLDTPATGEVAYNVETYTSGSDIEGIDAVNNKYLYLYELNSSRQVVKFLMHIVQTAEIKA